jgi:addiction module RelB/DinJ family antitoxin
MNDTNTTVISVKTDQKTKREAQKVAGELGIPLSTVLNAYLRQFVREREVRVSVEPTFLPEKAREFKQLLKDVREGKNLSPVFSNMSEALQYLKKK